MLHFVHSFICFSSFAFVDAAAVVDFGIPVPEFLTSVQNRMLAYLPCAKLIADFAY